MSGSPPTQYLYDFDGERTVGTLKDYASALEHSAYSGLEVGPLLDLYGSKVLLRHTTYTSDDWRVITLETSGRDDEVATYRIDLRA